MLKSDHLSGLKPFTVQAKSASKTEVNGLIFPEVPIQVNGTGDSQHS